MKMNSDVTFILPLHKIEDGMVEDIKRAVTSVKELRNGDDCKFIMVGPDTACEKFKEIYESVGAPQELTFVPNNDDLRFETQVNAAVSQCFTKYFSVLEFDDFYNEFALDVFRRYSRSVQYANVGVFLSLQELVDAKTERVDSFANEMAWSASFAENLGYVSGPELEVYYDFNGSGAFIKTEPFIANGGLKPSMKIASWYEFLLRMCYHQLDVFVIPKVCYVHFVGRDGSNMVVTKESMNEMEGSWLIEIAKQEYFFNEDRNKVFTEESAKAMFADIDQPEIGEDVGLS